MKKIIALILLLSTSSAVAQTQTPPEVALQINNIVGQWAQTLMQQSRQIEELQKQIAAKDGRIKELEAKKDEAPK